FLARFSPSGSEIAFYSTRFGTRDIFVMTAEGTNVSRVTDLATAEIYPDWSPDGTQIVFGSPLGARNRVMVVRRSGHDIWSRPRELVLPECRGTPRTFPRWSPDGRWIALPCGSSVALLSPDSAAPHLVHLPGLNVWYAEWGGDPNVLFVKEEPNGQIWAVALPSGQRRLLLRRDDSPRVAPRQEFATDGRRLFFTLAADEADIWIMDLTRQR
ncbi:MAG TPA: hypothetical protein VMM17_09145, partial [Gemmatimonadaceae bacterium]|nr:hypothetical protein [Gemmatimonadaceae bacterium]